MIRVERSRRCTWVPEQAQMPTFHHDTLRDLLEPASIFATRHDAEAFIASELRKCSRSGKNSAQGYWWGMDYGSPGVRVQFEMYDEPGSLGEVPADRWARGSIGWC